MKGTKGMAKGGAMKGTKGKARGGAMKGTKGMARGGALKGSKKMLTAAESTAKRTRRTPKEGVIVTSAKARAAAGRAAPKLPPRASKKRILKNPRTRRRR